MSRRFFTLPEIAEQMKTTVSQVRALVRSGELEGIQIGGRNQWRIEDKKLDDYIERMYEQQRQQRNGTKGETPTTKEPCE